MSDPGWEAPPRRGGRKSPETIPPERDEEILRRRREGDTYRAIAADLGVSLSAVHRRFVRLVAEGRRLRPPGE